MRWITLLLLGCLLAGWGACLWDSPSGTEESSELASAPRWIRTVDGWEQTSDLAAGRSMYMPPLHPLVIAAGQVMLVLMAFLLFPASGATASEATASEAAPPVERRRSSSDRRRHQRRRADRAATANA